MLAMMIPLVVFYEVSIPLARMVQPKKVSSPRGEDAGDDDLSRAPA